ncbi:MAG: ABC transporter substrate-binding protein [Clostridia bacterium]|nr:ABC transporter substrate-binding protein [Clostridia bacterium]
MKKLLAIILTIVLLLSLFSLTACGEQADVVNVYVPDGAPALSVASLMEEGATVNGHSLNVVVTTGAGVKVAVEKGDADIAILPMNACVALYNGGADIKLLSVQTWGNLFLVGKGGNSLSDAKGKVVHCIGQNDVPGKIFRGLLSYHGIEYVENSQTAVSDKVSIVYHADATTIIPGLKQGKIEYAVIAEPAASKVIGAPSKVVANLQQVWQSAYNTENAGYPQAGMVIGKDYYGNEAFLTDLLQKLYENDRFITENPTRADELLTLRGSTTAASSDLNRFTIARCGVKTIKATEAKSQIEAILPVYGVKKLPDLKFYL